MNPSVVLSRHHPVRWFGWLATAALIGLSVLGPSALGAAANGNNGTIKIHEQGTPSGSESNDPKVCVFNVEGFKFDAGQTGYLKFSVQGGDGPTGTAAGPFAWGPANASGFYASQYFNLAPGHYKATLYGKKTGGGIDLTDVKAKSKVFKVRCESASPSHSSSPSPSSSHSASPSPSESESASPSPSKTPKPSESASPTPTPTHTASPTPTPTHSGGVGGETGTPHATLPPTDTVDAQAQPASDTWRVLLLILAAMISALLLLTPSRSSRS